MSCLIFCLSASNLSCLSLRSSSILCLSSSTSGSTSPDPPASLVSSPPPPPVRFFIWSVELEKNSVKRSHSRKNLILYCYEELIFDTLLQVYVYFILKRKMKFLPHVRAMHIFVLNEHFIILFRTHVNNCFEI